MQNRYEAPDLTLLGEAHDIVMGMGSGGTDMPQLGAPDFEFEPDLPLI